MGCTYILYTANSMRRAIFRSEAERILSRLPVSYSNSRDFHGNTRASPPKLSDRVLCNAMRNRTQLIAIIRGGK